MPPEFFSPALGRRSSCLEKRTLIPRQRSVFQPLLMQPSHSLSLSFANWTMRSGGDFAVLQIFPQGNQELSRQGHHADLAAAAVADAEASHVPTRQLTLRLPTQPAPGQLHQQPAQPP